MFLRYNKNRNFEKTGDDMAHKRCWICGAGDFTSRLLLPAPDDLVVAADGGLAALMKLNIKPAFCLGDFDSLGYRPVGENVLAYPPEKDDTDMLLAVKYGLSHGCDLFYIYGGLGGRLSHTLANLQVLRYLCEKNCHGFLIDEASAVILAHNETVRFDASCAGMLSVFAFGGAAQGVTIENLKYTVEDARLSTDYPIGVSNEFIGAAASISVQNGTLALVWEHTKADFEKISFCRA